MTLTTPGPLVHGGPDAQGAVPHDFSTNGNACGPCPAALDAVAAADAARYPDPLHTVLRERLARFHGVDRERILIAASASEFIGRITAAIARAGGRRVRIPEHAYGDYGRAAQAWGLEIERESADSTSAAATASSAHLVWGCDPSSPLGLASIDDAWIDRACRAGATCVLDLAYHPLRLEGRPGWSAGALDRVWQLWTPNKALGLTGVRAAYAIAPTSAPQALMDGLALLAPSWPLGAHGVALLEAWVGDEAQQWLSGSRTTLAAWKDEQRAVCESLDWRCLPGVANFFCAWPDVQPAARNARLRSFGVKLRDTGSFGLPGGVRLGVLAPSSQLALRKAWLAMGYGR